MTTLEEEMKESKPGSRKKKKCAADALSTLNRFQGKSNMPLIFNTQSKLNAFADHMTK